MLRTSAVKLWAIVFVAALVFVACGSADDISDANNADTNNAETNNAETTATSDSTTSTDLTATTVEDAETGTTDQNVEPEPGPDAASEPDPDQSPPTTETSGLESGLEAAVAPDDLTCRRIEDLGAEAADRWRVINDGVMGGLSEGSLTFDGGIATFEGTINTDGGGFSMIRTSVFRDGLTLADALSGAEYLRIRMRSANGRAYELTVQDSNNNSSVMHFEDIAVSSDSGWQELFIPLTDFEARIVGQNASNVAPFELDQVTTFGIILADGRDGPFSLAVDRIDACST